MKIMKIKLNNINSNELKSSFKNQFKKVLLLFSVIWIIIIFLFLVSETFCVDDIRILENSTKMSKSFLEQNISSELDNVDSIKIDYLYLYRNNGKTSISYYLKLDNKNEKINYLFEIYYISDKNILQKLCSKGELFYNETKITCFFNKRELKEGTYRFIAKLYRIDKDDKILLKKTEKEIYISNNYEFSLDFKDKVDTKGRDITEIIIRTALINQGILKTDEENDIKTLRLYLEIPKSVIFKLTDENSKELIYSNTKYEIVEEDPLIAWNIEMPPKKELKLEINKKISESDKKAFRIKKIEDFKKKREYTMMKYALILIINIILLIIFAPILIKKKIKHLMK